MATTVDERLCEPLRQLPLERSPGPGGTEARNFMKRMNEFTGSYVKNLGTKSLPEGRNKRVRIAIIDSGVSRRDWDVREYIRLGRIADQRNFCSPRAPASDGYQGAHSKDVEDFHGHGTAVAKIALEVAPKADIYIAKVTNSENISAGELTNIFEAIIWAVEVWDVDIINLSLALDELSEEIDEALCAAFDQGNKIVFAAAHRNTGVNDEPTWPGTRAGVIPIYCTDGNGHAQGMNPKAEGVYFGTLGCDIPIRENFGSPARLAYGYASGASYATPIAAGIAANMLEIVRHTVAISRNGQALRRRYYTTNYMERLFRELNRPKEGCCFVEPWTFWRKTIRGNFQFQDRMLNKNDQRNISKVLELLASSS
ncbi:Peptidase S8/S53, subtilisin/kexin/sedolisin [Cordyceps fumosorosea ARSEF 2679]|uniref:Peptidase S8/S53, subtilisin/kexin/sedolisin n=1 Tax=Cordyceps fumosorosea (strain ARSEF 2679) TaxID=1081104 RepID=A0A168CCD4_CORFA|nr:Peptidase S8/S53, subtilisin/kexin/sedolisin [Cordyceps fumosorosea ARSEF 2679]OAA71218.1 Peptidase S8/S53, subtilisin/kexin/sedolisin [Cordyceps fumosorosea ARSEF 2679]